MDRVAVRRIPNVFESIFSCKRVFRELKMLLFVHHGNVLSALDVVGPPPIDLFQEVYVLTELMQTDLQRTIASPRKVSPGHVKVFLYQILRGLKYIHSANVMLGDLKPENILVNSNCVLKVCDFGLLRVEEPDRLRAMTTRCYTAPEILLGSMHYTAALDAWSVGCIFAELLIRRRLFQAGTPFNSWIRSQIYCKICILGTPSLHELRHACDGARAYMLGKPPKLHSLASLYELSDQATHEAVYLLSQMLTVDPNKRKTVAECLEQPYVEEGRTRYHSCMCKCCHNTAGDASRRYTSDFEPSAPTTLQDSWERELTTIQQVKEEMHSFLMQRIMFQREELCINPQFAALMK